MIIGKDEISFTSDDKKQSLKFPLGDVLEVKSSVYSMSKFGNGFLIRLKTGKKYHFTTYNNYDSLLEAINRAIKESRPPG